MQIQFSDDDVREFLRDVVQLGGVHSVDDYPNCYIRYAHMDDGDDNKVYLNTISNETKPLVIFNSLATDGILINPFAEGVGKDSDTGARATWFYYSRNLILAQKIVGIVRYVIQAGIEANSKPKPTTKKGSKKIVENETNLIAIKYLEGVVDKVNEDTLKDFDKISSNAMEFFTVFYNKKTRITDIACTPFKEVRTSKLKVNHPKDFWDIIRTIVLHVLHSDDIGEFAYQAEIVPIPMFESFLQVMMAIYERIQEGLSLVESPEAIQEDAARIERIRAVLDESKLEGFYFKARYARDANASTATSTMPARTASGTVPAYRPGTVPAVSTVPRPIPRVPVQNVVPVQPSMYRPPMNTNTYNPGYNTPVFGGMQSGGAIVDDHSPYGKI